LIFLLCLFRAVISFVILIPLYWYPKANWVYYLVVLICLLPDAVIEIILIRVGLKGYNQDEKRISFRNVGFPGNLLYWKYILVLLYKGIFLFLGAIVFFIPAFIIMSTNTTVTFILFIIAFLIPVFIITVIFYFIFEVLIDSEKEISISQVFQTSKELTRGIRWKLLGFYFIIMIPATLNKLFSYSKIFPEAFWRNYIFILIGSFLIFPIEILTRAYLYKNLKVQNLDSQTKSTEFD